MTVNDENSLTALIINDTAHVIGGAAEVAIETASLLASSGVDVIFFAANSPIDTRLHASGITTVLTEQPLCTAAKNRAAGAIQGLWNEKAYRMLLDIIDTCENPLVAHVHSWTKALSASIFDALYKKNVPTCVTAHDYFLVCPNGGLYDYRNEEICTLMPMTLHCMLKNCDRRSYSEKIYRCIRMVIQKNFVRKALPQVIHVSAFSEGIIQKHAQRLEKGDVVRNPVNPPLRFIVDAWKNESYAFIGRVCAEKGAELFCEAVTRAGVKACIIGDGDMVEELRERYPQITFYGWVNKDNMTDILKSIRVCILPSLCYEAAPLTTTEVMISNGIPFIVSDECAARDDIVNGKTGLLFKSGNVESLVDEIKKTRDDGLVEELCSSIRSSFPENTSENIKRYYTQRLLAAYTDVLKIRNDPEK